jgi:hypothetical protein
MFIFTFSLSLSGDTTPLFVSYHSTVILLSNKHYYIFLFGFYLILSVSPVALGSYLGQGLPSYFNV